MGERVGWGGQQERNKWKTLKKKCYNQTESIRLMNWKKKVFDEEQHTNKIMPFTVTDRWIGKTSKNQFSDSNVLRAYLKVDPLLFLFLTQLSDARYFNLKLVRSIPLSWNKTHWLCQEFTPGENISVTVTSMVSQTRRHNREASSQI